MLYALAHIIRDKMPWLWDLVDMLNSWLFTLRYGKKLRELSLELRELRLEVKGERLKVKGERLKVKGERLEVKGERLKVKDERLEVKDERLEVRGERLKIKGERLEVKDERLKVKEEPFTFVFVGRIVKDKGTHELACAMKQLEGAKLIMVGSFEDSDPVAPEDKEFFETSEKVECVGWQDNVKPYLLRADALVFPSYREGFPNAPMQAGAMDLPCIVTNINGCNEIIKDGLNGKIIQPRNEKALLETMRWFVEHPEDVRRMGNNARKMIQERYEQKDVWRALLDFYRDLG